MLPAIQDNAPVMDGLRFTHDGHDYKVRGNKLYRHHEVTDALEVAVVYSPGFGGGWSTWNDKIDATDARVALTYLSQAGRFTTEPVRITVTEDVEEEYHKVVVIHKAKGHTSDYAFDIYPDGGCELTIRWLPAGTLYQIDEYDGYESIQVAAAQTWRIA